MRSLEDERKLGNTKKASEAGVQTTRKKMTRDKTKGWTSSMVTESMCAPVRGSHEAF